MGDGCPLPRVLHHGRSTVTRLYSLALPRRPPVGAAVLVFPQLPARHPLRPRPGPGQRPIVERPSWEVVSVATVRNMVIVSAKSIDADK